MSPICSRSQQVAAQSAASKTSAADATEKQEEAQGKQAVTENSGNTNTANLDNSVSINRSVVSDADLQGASETKFSIPDNASVDAEPATAQADAQPAKTGGYGGGEPATGAGGGTGATDTDGITGTGGATDTDGGTAVDGEAKPPGPEVDRNINFHELGSEERSELGLNDDQRAIEHLWGRQIISQGYQDGGIYYNVMQNPENFQPAEVALVNRLAAQEQEQFGGINGKLLDQEFFNLAKEISPDFPQEKIDAFMATPARFAEGPVNIISDVAGLEAQTGLNDVQQASLRLWGHENLFNGGKIDGSILAYTIGNDNALDSDALGGEGANIDNIAKGLLRADLASDGVRDGDSLKSAFMDTLDSIYLGADKPTMQSINRTAAESAVSNGRTLQQVKQDVTTGMQKAMQDATSFVKDHPVISTMAAGGIAAAAAVCPFLGGAGAAAAGVMAGQSMMNKASA